MRRSATLDFTKDPAWHAWASEGVRLGFVRPMDSQGGVSQDLIESFSLSQSGGESQYGPARQERERPQASPMARVLAESNARLEKAAGLKGPGKYSPEGTLPPSKWEEALQEHNLVDQHAKWQAEQEVGREVQDDTPDRVETLGHADDLLEPGESAATIDGAAWCAQWSMVAPTMPETRSVATQTAVDYKTFIKKGQRLAPVVPVVPYEDSRPRDKQGIPIAGNKVLMGKDKHGWYQTATFTSTAVLHEGD